MLEITQSQLEAIEYVINWAYDDAVKEIEEAKTLLDKDFKYSYQNGTADRRFKYEIIKYLTFTFVSKKSNNESLRSAVVEFLDRITSDYFAWYPISSTSNTERRCAEIRREALEELIDRIGNLNPLVERGTKLKKLFK